MAVYVIWERHEDWEMNENAKLFELRFQVEGSQGTGPEMTCLRNRKWASEKKHIENKGGERSRWNGKIGHKVGAHGSHSAHMVFEVSLKTILTCNFSWKLKLGHARPLILNVNNWFQQSSYALLSLPIPFNASVVTSSYVVDICISNCWALNRLIKGLIFCPQE